MAVIHPQGFYGLVGQGGLYNRWRQREGRADSVKLEIYWGKPGSELHITAGLRKITASHLPTLDAPEVDAYRHAHWDHIRRNNSRRDGDVIV